MAIKSIDELSELHFDVLREIGNIGSGNAATALSSLLQTTIDISVPNVKVLDFNETINFLGGAEKIVVGLLLDFHGEISGLILYLIQKEFAEKIVDTFFGTKLEDLTMMNEMEQSAASEVGNIMAGSYVNAIASLTGLEVDISPPSLCIDMAGAILNVPLINYAALGDKVLFVDDSFKINDGSFKCDMVLIPEMNSLQTLFGRLGIEL